MCDDISQLDYGHTLSYNIALSFAYKGPTVSCINGNPHSQKRTTVFFQLHWFTVQFRSLQDHGSNIQSTKWNITTGCKYLYPKVHTYRTTMIGDLFMIMAVK